MSQPASNIITYAATILLSIVLLSCGDDKSSNLQADKAHQVTTSINGVNQIRTDIITTQCTCTTPTGGSDLQKCIDENQPDSLTLSDCQTTATTCDPDSYIAYMNCQRDALQTFNTCLQSCPDSTAQTQCVNAFDTKIESCDAHITTQLSTAFQSCNSNQTPACANTPNPDPKPDPKPDNNQCISTDSFLARTKDRSWSSTYHAGSDGTIACKNYEACISEYFRFSPDNTYTSSWFSYPRYQSINPDDAFGPSVCSHGTWQLQCDQLTMTNCSGTTTSTIRLTNDAFKLDNRTFKDASWFDENTGITCKSNPCNQ